MDRAEAIETLKKISEHVKHNPEYGITFSHQWVGAYEMALAALRDQEQREWISVEDRLPAYGERVLITEGHAVFEASLSISHKWVRSGIGWSENVTHWMPLPEPPKD